ncbi:hypothetical protein ES705_29222 [subsurface metagenome]
MPGRGFHPADPELKAKARQLREQGQSLADIAEALSVSTGAVSNWCRGIAKPAARATVVKKEGGYRGRDMLDTTIDTKPDQETVDLANRLRRERLQAELDELADNRRARVKLAELEAKAKEAELAEREARLKLSSGAPEGMAEIASLRDDRDRLERELAALRHDEQMDELKRGMAAQLDLFRNALAGRDRVGKTSYDLMSEFAGRAENLLTLGASKIDKAVSRFTTANDLKLAMSLGLSPGELEVYMAGPVVVPDFNRWRSMRAGVARQSGETIPGDEELKEEWQGVSQAYAARNEQYQAVAASIERTKAMAMAASGKRSPASLVVPSDTVPVKCSSCGNEVSVDKADPVIARTKAGKCPGCGAIMDLTKLFPIEAKPKEVTFE